ncbi:MAG: ABC transporter ATP-binding protein [Gammaproteobacteria bacterium]|nr:ABC transporter ATP-binding protein [Gammaproteobacteria bacterium]
MKLGVHKLELQRGGKTLCRDFSAEFKTGQCWGVLGPNGAGKSTLLHCLAGLYPAQRGNVELNGQTLGTIPRRALARQLGILLQASVHGFPATVMETVLQGRHPHLRAWEWESESDRRLARTTLRRVGLETLVERRIDTLSGGEHQRMAIATLLTQDPSFMLLDEPVNHLDLHQQIRILEDLGTMSGTENKLVMMVLHDVNLTQRFCDHVILVHGDGEITAGPVAELMSSENLSRLYAHPMQSLPGPHGPIYVPG